MSNPRVHPIILAGGRGTRFWPLSRRARPKPFLRLGGGRTLLETTWNRARLLAPRERIYVAVEERLSEEVGSCLPDLPSSNILTEARPRDTAPAVAHAVWKVGTRVPNPMIAILPADHIVEKEKHFVEAMEVAAHGAAEHDALVCLGVPAGGRPETGYGYIECSERAPHQGEIRRVDRFVEKPDRTAAEELLARGRSLWNSGMFLGTSARFHAELTTTDGPLANATRRLHDDGDARRFFETVPAVSFDRGVMERSGRTYVVGADMGWDDLGTWEALVRHLPTDDAGNAGRGRRLALEARGCLCDSPDKRVVLLDVEDLIIVNSPDVLLVARRRAAQEVRDVPEKLAQEGWEDLT